MILPASPEVVTGYIEAAQNAPEELSTIGNFMLAPPMPFIPEEVHGKPVLMGLYAYVGPVDQADSVIAPFRALGEPLADMVRPMRYPELYEGPEQEAAFASGVQLLCGLARAVSGRGDLRGAPEVHGDDEGGPAAGSRRSGRPRRRTTRPRSPTATRACS